MLLLTLMDEAALPTDWEGILNRWGLPTLLLFATGFAVYRCLKWLAPRVDRLVNSHVDLVDTLKARLEKIEQNGEDANDKLASIERELRERRQS